jgi:transposase
MKLHGNAALSWSGRRLLVERALVQGWTLTAAAAAAGVSVRCARKWIGRYRLEGERGLLDRSSAPRRVANRTPAERVAAIVALRQLRMTAAEIAETLAMPLSTVSAILKRAGIGRLGRIWLERPVRYERSRPGELVHIDVKKLGRIEDGAGIRVAERTPGSYRPRRRDASRGADRVARSLAAARVSVTVSIPSYSVSSAGVAVTVALVTPAVRVSRSPSADSDPPTAEIV